MKPGDSTRRLQSFVRKIFYPVLASIFFLLPLSSVLGGAAFAADPDHVGFTLEGCRKSNLPAGYDLEANNFICTDDAYTTGNLQGGWNELDLVPYRITATQSGGGGSVPNPQTYTVGLVLDGINGGVPGYDVLGLVTKNPASHSSCVVNVGVQQSATPGVGGTDTSIYRLITITQNRGSTCIIDYVGRLAVGASDYPGSSLHANVTLANLQTAGIGARDVSIPVDAILPQDLRKDMNATQDADFTWNITKGPTPASVEFGNTCDPDTPTQKDVKIRVEWEIVPGAPGLVTVITNIYAKNPAARTITVSVTDKIFSGLTLLDTATSGGVDVPANTELNVLTHTFNAPATVTNLNDTATATYVDKETNIPVPGATEATASALITPGAQTNSTATITDVESISGNGLSFSVNSTTGATGSFLGYTPPTTTTGPVTWKSDDQTANGFVEFNKTIYIAGPIITTGTLTDTAVVNGSDGFTTDATADVTISSTTTVSLTINKTISDVLDGTETATFTFRVKSNDVEVAAPTLTFDADDPTTKSVTVTGLAPGAYTVSEDAVPGWVIPSPKSVTIAPSSVEGISSCSGQVSFNNTSGTDNPAKAKVKKVTSPAGSEADWDFTLNGPNTPTGGEKVTTTGTGFVDFTTVLQEGSYTITETAKTGWTSDGGSAECSFTVNYPADAARVFSCTFTNTRDTGSLKIEKTLNNPDVAIVPFSFSMNYNCTPDGPTGSVDVAAGGSATVSNIPTGSSCTVTESAPASIPGYTWGTPVISGSPASITTKGATVTVSVTNSITRDRGSLKILKTLSNPDNAQVPASFSVNYNCGTGYTGQVSVAPGSPATVNGIPTGSTCTVTEVAPAVTPGYTWGTITYTPASVVISTLGETVEITVGNSITRDKGTIIVIKNAKPAQGSFAFTTTGEGYEGFTLTGATTNNGNKNSQTLPTGTYSVQEGTQLGWILTGIGGSTADPYKCTVTGSGGSTGVGNLGTQTATIELKKGDTVTCVFENTGNGATRTQGFWATHPQLAQIAWFGGSAFGHTFPGVATTIGDTLICGRSIDTLGKETGAFWSDISKKSTGAKRTALDQGRMQLLQQLMAAELNASAFGSVPSGGSGQFAAWETALCGTNTQAISTAQQQAASFNSNGDSASFTPGTSADSKLARSIADYLFWDIIKP